MKNKGFIFIVPLVLLFANQYGNCQEIHSGQYNEKDFHKFLTTKTCERCNLNSIDLVNSDLKNSVLMGSKLKKANLSGSNLDGANLRNTDLSYTTLSSSSLRNVDLRGSILTRTDLRNSDLTGAILDYGSLRDTYWDNAKGINVTYQSFEEIYNAGVSKYKKLKYREAELLFSKAIKKDKYKEKSLIARAASRVKQEKILSAIEDLNRASEIYRIEGKAEESELVKILSQEIKKEKEKKSRNEKINRKVQTIVKGLTIMRMFSPGLP